MDQDTARIVLVAAGAALVGAVISAAAHAGARRCRRGCRTAVVDCLQRLMAQAHTCVAGRAGTSADSMGTARQLLAIYLLGRLGRAHRWVRPAVLIVLSPLCDQAGSRVPPTVARAARTECAALDRRWSGRGNGSDSTVTLSFATAAGRPPPTGRSGRHRRQG